MTQNRFNHNKSGVGHRGAKHRLRAGNFRKIAGAPIIGEKYQRRRRWLYALASAITALGGYFAIF